MAQERPTDAQYKKWLEDNHGVRVDARLATYYNTVASSIRAAFVVPWTELNRDFPRFSEQYLVAKSFFLFAAPLGIDIEIQTKSFDSFINKTYRKNVIENENWPEPPPKGWLLPDNWYSRVGDIARTRIVAKYLDGVSYLIECITTFCVAHGLGIEASYVVRDEGYYAAHIDLSLDTNIPAVDWDSIPVRAHMELQISTQLQDVIGSLTHQYYTTRRDVRKNSGAVQWQWQWDSDEFSANYLGHLLHYLEGMIMDVRERQRVSPNPGTSKER